MWCGCWVTSDKHYYCQSGSADCLHELLSSQLSKEDAQVENRNGRSRFRNG